MSERAPFLQIVVLFASDPKVILYAQKVQNIFMNAGVDVLMYRHRSAAPGADIKPEHLVSIITSTLSDFLIVIGDRNMKNNTCQGRRSGKLVEMSLDDRLRTLLAEWARLTGQQALFGADANLSPEGASALSFSTFHRGLAAPRPPTADLAVLLL